MVERDYHHVLGISPTAEEAEIKAAYRRLARKYHPDVNRSPDAATRFTEATKAYEVLIDRLQREEEDQSDSGSSGACEGSSSADSGLSPEEMFHHAGVSIRSRQAGPQDDGMSRLVRRDIKGRLLFCLYRIGTCIGILMIFVGLFFPLLVAADLEHDESEDSDELLRDWSDETANVIGVVSFMACGIILIHVSLEAAKRVQRW